MNMSDQRTIVHVSSWARTFTQFRLPLLHALRKEGVSQVLCCPDEQPHSSTLVSEGFDVHPVALSSRPGPGVISGFARLFMFLRRVDPDMVVVHQPMGALMGIPAAIAAGVDTRVYSTGGLRFVPDDRGFANSLIRMVERALIRRCRAVLLVNKEDYQILSEDADSRVSTKAKWVGPRGGCGLNTKLFNPDYRSATREQSRNELNLSDDCIALGVVGRCVWEKGFRELIDAARLVEKEGGSTAWKIFVLGDGPHREEIEKYTRENEVEHRFSFMGYRPEPRFFMSAFDLFLLPSYREGLPVALLEAMGLGVACIATDIRGNRELIDDGRTGTLVPAGDAAALAEAMLRMMSSRDARECTGVAGADLVSAQYSEDALLPQVCQILTDALSR